MKNVFVMINEYGLGHVNEFLGLYEKLKDCKDINFKYCLTADLIPASAQTELKKIFKDNLFLYKAIGKDLNYLKTGIGIPRNVLNNTPTVLKCRKIFKNEPDLICFNFCLLPHVFFRDVIKHNVQIWGGMGKYLNKETLNKETFFNKFIIENALKGAGMNHSHLHFNLTSNKISEMPTSINGSPCYNVTPIIPQKEQPWELPFKEYSLIYFTTYAPQSSQKGAVQIAKENPQENFIVFGHKIPENHKTPKNIYFAGLVEAPRFLYALRRANAYIGTLGLGPTTESYRLNIPIYGIPLHAEQATNIQFCPDAVILQDILEYTKKKGTWVEDSNKNTATLDSASFIAEKIQDYLRKI